MDKLIAKYRAEDNGNLKDMLAIKIRQHNRKHPMAACMLAPADCATLNEILGV